MTTRIRVPTGGPGCPEPAQLLTVTAQRNGSAAVVTARGEIDLYTAPLLASALREAIQLDPEVVVVDLTDVTFMASSGLAALLAGLDLAQQRRCVLRLAGGGRAVWRPLQAAGLTGHFEHYDSMTDALHHGPDQQVDVTARTVPLQGTR